MSSLFWANFDEGKKFRERRRAMSVTGHNPVIHAVCLRGVIKTGRMESASVARHGALDAQEHSGLQTDGALSNSACMLVLGLLKGGCLIALVMEPHGKNDPDPHEGSRPYSH